MDDETMLLVAQLSLQEIEGFAYGNRNEDEDFALRLQAEELREFIRLNSQLPPPPENVPEAGPSSDAPHQQLDPLGEGSEEESGVFSLLSLDSLPGTPQGTPSPSPGSSLLSINPNLLSQDQRDPPGDDAPDTGSEIDATLSNVEETATTPIYPICMRCLDEIPTPPIFRAPCGHNFCLDCLTDYLNSYLTNESLHPLRCCQLDIPSLEALELVEPDLRTKFNLKLTEYLTPVQERLYCCNPRCSIFLDSTVAIHDGIIVCPSCDTRMCVACKEVDHPTQPCATAGDPEFVALSKEQKWQRCPGCQSTVERTEGCPHMVCRCKVEFCYRCGEVYGNHVCAVAD